MSRGRLALWAATAALWAVIGALWLWLPSAPTWPFVTACAALAGLLWVIEATATRPARQRPPRAARPLSAAEAEAAIAVVVESYPLPPPVPDMMTAPYPGHDHGPGSPPCPACLGTLRMLAGLAGATVETGATRIASPAEVADAQAAADARAIMAGHDAQAANYAADQAERAAAMLRELGAPLTSGPPCGASWGGHLCRVRPAFAQAEHAHLCACGTIWGRPDIPREW